MGLSAFVILYDRCDYFEQLQFKQFLDYDLFECFAHVPFCLLHGEVVRDGHFHVL